jgi:hypothetical protein
MNSTVLSAVELVARWKTSASEKTCVQTNRNTAAILPAPLPVPPQEFTAAAAFSLLLSQPQAAAAHDVCAGVGGARWALLDVHVAMLVFIY